MHINEQRESIKPLIYRILTCHSALFSQRVAIGSDRDRAESRMAIWTHSSQQD